ETKPWARAALICSVHDDSSELRATQWTHLFGVEACHIHQSGPEAFADALKFVAAEFHASSCCQRARIISDKHSVLSGVGVGLLARAFLLFFMFLKRLKPCFVRIRQLLQKRR